ncbi:hypothetical protein ACG2OD_23290 [Streptomyces sp. PDY-4]|uniref:hypothetical protein n=1 Tax=Streptomyces sp. PDY-4 TaxID=3376070 RepID=UPI0037AC7A7D
MTHRLAHALAVLYALTALGLFRCAVTSWQNGSWPFALFFTGASVLLITATVHHSWQRDELRYAHARLEHAARPPELHPAVADEIALGWQALDETCCLRWWESKEKEHEPGCERHRSTA